MSEPTVVYIVIGDRGVPFAHEDYVASVHQSREGAEAALTALGDDGEFGQVLEMEVKREAEGEQKPT